MSEPNAYLGSLRAPIGNIAQETHDALPAVGYGFRSFDRQWIIPDSRVLNDPRPRLWPILSERQVFITAPDTRAPGHGPAFTICAEIPDQNRFAGSGGGAVHALYADSGTTSALAPGLLDLLAQFYGAAPTSEDVFAYIAAVLAHPEYVRRFLSDLTTAGLRVPLTADRKLFSEAALVGCEIVWLHTSGQRFVDPAQSRPNAAPRMSPGLSPTVPKNGAIPGDAARFPDTLEYDATANRLYVGEGFVDHVSPAVWAYSVSGKQVLRQWFSYRKKNRERPIIGDRRKPSALGDIQPVSWLAEYTEDLINLLHVLGRLVLLEPIQADLLNRICAGPLILANLVADARPPVTTPEKVEGKRRQKVKVVAQRDLSLQKR